MTVRRRPRWVYDMGAEPDYRFSLANERTMLAWLRTCLALMAGGVAVNAVDVGLDTTEALLVARALLLLGCLCAAGAWWQWARIELAMRQGAPLPSTPLLPLATAVVALVAVVVLVTLTRQS
jgi:putative membrane protein